MKLKVIWSFTFDETFLHSISHITIRVLGLLTLSVMFLLISTNVDTEQNDYLFFKRKIRRKTYMNIILLV